MYQNVLNSNSNSTSYGGMKAEEKTDYLNQSVITGYIKGFSSFIPSSIKSSIKKQIMNSPVTFEDEKDTIVGTYFDECFIQGEKHKILINCYNNGFQIWDLNHSEGVKEILSSRDGLIKFCKVLANPAEPDDESSPFYGKRPLLAVVSGEDVPNSKVGKNMVRIISLQTTELVNMYKFRSPIYNVLSNNKLILVVLKERIVGFDPNNMNKEISLASYPSVSPLGVIALGSRWIAFTDYESKHQQSQHHLYNHQHHLQQQQQNSRSLVPQNQTFGDTAVDVASDIAKEVAQKLYYFGDIGRKKVSSYLYPEDSSLSNQLAQPQLGLVQDKPNENCVIVIYDFIKKKVVTLIKPPHSHPISYLAFDPTGTILFTSTTEGTKVNTYQIIPFTNSLNISSPIVHSANKDSGVGSKDCSNKDSIVIVNNNNVGGSNSSSANSGNIPNEQLYRHIYILKRGITNASIQGIVTNETCKWVALTTSRGTTHIFAINPLGGEVDIHTHITRSPNTKRPYDYYSSVLNLTPSLLTINAMDRIKLGNDNEESSVTSNMCGGNACFIESNSQNLEKLFVVSPTGQLILYELRPQKPPLSSEMAENTLCLSLTPVAEWDVCRKTRSPEYKSHLIPYTLEDFNDQINNNNQSQLLKVDAEARWLYNVEIITHSQDIRAIWGVPQFTFRSSSSCEPSSAQSSSSNSSNVNGVSFFDQDYPTGEAIKFEKRKNISPRIQDGSLNYLGSSPNSLDDYKATSFDNNYFVNIKDEDDIEIIEKLNEAIKTPITKTTTVPIAINNNNNNSNNSSHNGSFGSNSGSNNSRLVGPPLSINNNNNNNNNFNNFNNTLNGTIINNTHPAGYINSNNSFSNPIDTDALYINRSFSFDEDDEKDLIPNPITAGLKYNDSNSSLGKFGSNNNLGGLGMDDDDDFPSYPALAKTENKFTPPIIIENHSDNIVKLPLDNIGKNNKNNSNSGSSTTTTTTSTQSQPIPIVKKSSSSSSSSSPKESNNKNETDQTLAGSFSSSSSTQSATSPSSPKPNLSSPPKSSSKKKK
ncbi:hypothetical protein DICPUDRAFT_99826 [Dictyostelium purpureum]|uniref:Uncharacterized protein n=1 Tax=Dictyostelium purpureum TaxID=5786 RepID=F1A2W5_DICPU|nr:uncharacterized protein DICPUDRAFT_99826 [Dictyostelium purpureum]EGC29465.1 hypothetical protein DICPUDRAFT_99826 [Dictyostelium purpureum]|eukprot:XP_003294008.1 hypothetical protein DICPUDRAFT_99826 [Dictyostelium purpureum]